MPRFKARLAKVAAQLAQRSAQAHFVSVAFLDSGEDVGAVTCACGVMGCPQHRVGAIVPKPLLAEAWRARARAYARDIAITAQIEQ